MTRPRDTQRQRVYDAEAVLKPLAKELPTISDIEAFARKLLARKRLRNDLWVIANRTYKMDSIGENRLFRVPKVKDGRGRRRAGGRSAYITMPKWSRNDWITCHELAHSITERIWGPLTPAHGEQFCGAYLLLVKHGMGQEAYTTLRRSFAESGVNFRA